MYLIKSGSIFEVSNGKETEFLSPFGEEVFQHDRRSWEQESWKYKDDEAEAAKGFMPRGMLWGGQGKLNKPARVKTTYVAGTAERLYYVLEMTNSCGLFYYDFARDQEIRLFHKRGGARRC